MIVIDNFGKKTGEPGGDAGIKSEVKDASDFGNI